MSAYRYTGGLSGHHSVRLDGRLHMLDVAPGMEPVELDERPGSLWEPVEEKKEKPARKRAARPADADQE